MTSKPEASNRPSNYVNDFTADRRLAAADSVQLVGQTSALTESSAALKAALAHRLERLEAAIAAILPAKGMGMSEFELLQQLSEPPYSLISDAARRNELSLFQSHFLVFHALYRIRARNRPGGSQDSDHQRSELCIHALHIGYFDAGDESPGGSKEALKADGGFSTFQCRQHMAGSGDALSSYYLDLENLYGTSEADVKALLAGFWRLLSLEARRQD